MANENEHGFTEDEWSQLSEPERQAIAGDDYDEEQEQDDPENAPEQEEQPNDEGNEDVPDNITESDLKEGEDDPEPEPEQQPEQENEPESEPPADPREQFKTQIADADSELEELEKQLDDGEIEFSEFRKLEKEINNRKIEANAQISSINAREEANQAIANQRFIDARDRFLAKPGNDVLLKDELVANALNTAMRTISTTPEARGKSYDWLFEQGKERLVKAGFNFPGSDKTTESNSDNKKPDPRKDRSKQPDLPQTLGDAPAASGNTSDEFTELDGLEGMEFEKALSAMSQEKQDKYLRG